MNDEVFINDIKANLDDPGRMVAYADWLEEHGRTKEAFAYRFCVKNGKRPTHIKSGPYQYRWLWCTRKKGEAPSYIKPGILGSYFRTWNNHHYKSFEEAMAALVEGLNRLKDYLGY